MIIDPIDILQTLDAAVAPDTHAVRDALARASEKKGLSLAEVAALSSITDPEQLDALFQTARNIKNAIYGNRVVLFAPLYISNLCGNECLYCAFRNSNTHVKRAFLSQEQIAAEVKALVEQGHKRILMVAGESYPEPLGFRYILNAIETIYKTRSGPGEIRRVNANIAPLTLDEFKELKRANIGTYQLFQETYQPLTYKKVHLKGKKSDYDWRITGFDRAMEAGIDDVGMGVLFGLSDWKFEVLALLQHALHLERLFGSGPHTISVPRIEPAVGSPFSQKPPHAVSDNDFLKIVAILRCAVPYTGIIMSTRETPAIRRETFSLGVSQISAGSRTDPGGYTDGNGKNGDAGGQFSLGDTRSLDEVVRDLSEQGFIPSFCTACYRLGRTGTHFMEYAKPGEIKSFCGPNACATFAEYLEDYASPETKQAGYALIEKTLEELPSAERTHAKGLLGRVKKGERDCYC